VIKRFSLQLSTYKKIIADRTTRNVTRKAKKEQGGSGDNGEGPIEI